MRSFPNKWLTLFCAMQPEPEPEPKPEDMEVDEEERTARGRRAEAQKEKEAGNAAYKARQFEDAVAHYNKAIELDGTDISFLTNRCAACRSMLLREGMRLFSH